MPSLIAHVEALIACVVAAALLPRWRRARGPVLEMVLLTGLFGLVYMSWVKSTTIVAIVLAYTFVRAQQLLVQSTEVAVTQPWSTWSCDPRAAVRGLHLLPFAGTALFSALPSGAHRLTDCVWPLLTGLLALATPRVALPIAVLTAVSAGLAVYL